MKVGDLILWGKRKDIWLVVNVSKAKKTWHRVVEIYHPSIGVIETSWKSLREADVKILGKDPLL